jgi:MoaA/NifB/PqqE/SkfB family radical SAM enzyme
MKLEDIGFYTLSDERARTASSKSPLSRCELILTDRCNFNCTYCRGLKPEYKGDMPYYQAEQTVRYWLNHGLRNVRFSGGEPTLYPNLKGLVEMCRAGGCEHIAISTNGSASLDYYAELIEAGVNDFSISLDSGCCSIGEKMAGGIPKSWERACRTIEALSPLTYVTVGMVFTEANYDESLEAVKFVDSLNPHDIRVIPAAQYDKALSVLSGLPKGILNKYPILNYRLNNIESGRHVRGLTGMDTHKCRLVLDDMAVVADKHYPCIIYLREQGKPIGDMVSDFREQRAAWYLHHDSIKDEICRNNCLDVCIDYNNKAITHRTNTVME